MSESRTAPKPLLPDIAKVGREALAARLSASIEQGGSDDCWPCRLAPNSAGYGRLHLRAAGRTVFTHRLAWVLANGRDLGPGEIVCHTCDNPLCCNPAHLFVGTHRDNVHDMMSKGRKAPYPSGERHHSAKITADQAREIARCPGTHAEIARRFGLGETAVQDIKAGRTWGRETGIARRAA